MKGLCGKRPRRSDLWWLRCRCGRRRQKVCSDVVAARTCCGCWAIRCRARFRGRRGSRCSSEASGTRRTSRCRQSASGGGRESEEVLREGGFGKLRSPKITNEKKLRPRYDNMYSSKLTMWENVTFLHSKFATK